MIRHLLDALELVFGLKSLWAVCSKLVKTSKRTSAAKEDAEKAGEAANAGFAEYVEFRSGTLRTLRLQSIVAKYSG